MEVSQDEKDWNSDEYFYNVNWSHLMPVIEKIEGLGYNVKFDSNEYVAKTCGSDISNFKTIYISNFGGNLTRETPFTNSSIAYKRYGGNTNKTKIQAVYEASLLFIDWYNLLNK